MKENELGIEQKSDTGQSNILFADEKRYISIAGKDMKIENPGFPVEYLIIHHSATKDTKEEDSIGIKKYHKEEKRWTDIGYHWMCEFVDQRYEIIKGRPMTQTGAHCRAGRMNKKSLGFCMVGNFENNKPPDEQLFLTKSVVRDFQRMFSVPRENVLGHREAERMAKVANNNLTDCPGKNLDMNLFRKDLLT